MPYEGLNLDIRDKVAVLAFNRPGKMNSLTSLMAYDYLPRIFRDLNNDDSVRAVVITGQGSSFCTGADVREMLSGYREGKLQQILEQNTVPIVRFALDLYKLEKPVIAAMNGMVAGGGLAITLLSDIRYASDQALFTAVFASRGIAPDCGTSFLLPRLVGTANAFELMYTGDIITASQAEHIGLVNKVIPHTSLMDEALNLARRIADGSPTALKLTKRAIRFGIINTFEQQLYFETYAQKHCFNTKDFDEGLRSFVERRAPNFQGA